MKIGTMITARNNSERFPGKVVALLGGKPMITQIILRAKKLSARPIVVSTSWNGEDDILEKIAGYEEVECYRGHPTDLFSRHRFTVEKFDLTAWIDLSGDCPFTDLDISQRLIDAWNKNPNYDQYGILEPFCVIEGNFTGIVTKSYLEKIGKMLADAEDKEWFEEQYWIVANRYPADIFKVKLVDCNDILPVEKTQIKTSIDYPLELALFNRVIKYLGCYPEKYKDIIRAFKEIKTL